MKRSINYYLLLWSGVLILSGIFFSATVSAPISMQVFGTTNYYFFHQLFAFALGLVLCIVIIKVPLDFFKKISPYLLLVNLLFLVLVFIPFLGAKFWGAKRWISIGNNTLQPSEFLKITAIIFIAAWVSEKFSKNVSKNWIFSAKKSYDDFIKVFLPFVTVLGIISIILLFQKDISTLGIIMITLIAIYFAADTPLWHTLLLIAIIIGGALIAIRIEPYRVQRFLTFLHPENDPLGVGFQVKQSLLTLGSGGIFGKGLGMSTEKFGLLPQAMSDSLFAILGEELGIVGCTAIIISFLMFFWQSIKIAANANGKFPKLIAIGITTWLAVQTFMNILSVIGLWPLSGIPLPFFSYGGSHIVAEMMSIGLLLNISRNT